VPDETILVGSLLPTAEVNGGILVSTILIGAPESPPPTLRILQRIFDTSLSQYVYYTEATENDAPDQAATAPNHTGNLDAATHEVLSRTVV
jgi:hypothetical protein